MGNSPAPSAASPAGENVLDLFSQPVDAPAAKPAPSAASPGNPGAADGDQGAALAKWIDTTSKKMASMEATGAEVAKRATAAEDKLGQIGKIFNPEFAQPKEPDLDESVNALLDYALEKGLEMDRSGQGGMPITIDTIAKLKQVVDRSKAQQKIIDELNTKVSRMTDPSTSLDHDAYKDMDKMIDNGVFALQGRHDPHYAQMVVAKMQPVLEKIQKETPDQWDRMRRNTELQKRFVNHFVAESVPKKAREILQNEMLQNTEQTVDDLRQAFREAGEAFKDDPEQRKKIRTAIRQELLSKMAMGRHWRER